MVSFRSLFVAAATFAFALAQTTPNIAFSSVPPVAQAGSTYNITWGGGDGTSVTLTLRRGNPNNLDTVAIIASRITGNSYLWTVATNLETASDYALQIQQGVNGINYSGTFSIVGGTGSSSISYSGLTTATNGTIITTGVIATRTGTDTITGTGTDASMGTGTNMPRNTTFISPTLTSAARTSTSIASSRAATTIQQQTSAPSGNGAATMGSSAALVMGLFGAIMFLH